MSRDEEAEIAGSNSRHQPVHALVARSPRALAHDLVALVAPLPDPARVLLDGLGGGSIADAMVAGLLAAGRAPCRVRGADYLRPAGERFAYGREDPDAFREGWLDAGALRREVLAADGTWLPALRDAGSDRSARRQRLPLPRSAVLLVDGLFLLGRDLPAELTVHVALSRAALLRRGVPAWQLPAFTTYDALVQPDAGCDVLVRAEDPLRPAVLIRR